MNSRKLVGLFFKTLLIGGITGLITSFFVNTDGIYTTYLDPVNVKELIGLVIFYTGFGFLSSVVSQTGFFAYLFINRFGLGFFKGMWPAVQVLLIAFVAFDLVYFPYQETKGEVALYWYILMSAAIVGYGLIIAKIKASQTNQRAFVPALFLMVVMTSVEWVPALRAEGTDYAWLMIVPLLACNTYQLLVLHKLTRDEHGQPIETNGKNQQTNKK
ncbi:KinB-signaling pathway activation protein [Lentibacillus sp. JNUCC-1]|uniref:KinB-signaling pathway activation protein n=1 Tax=Lentibacillus sp. JNUCC-1 TaxID=2654513 RepID=UPI0012E758AE|nr:KinB-signaling pathway activation protein [Lentibacillus sp. JNUCC-1]MUV38132.1 KinB-signaling pathway activation protein [Lentibacillus sp. JNUCC-1]